MVLFKKIGVYIYKNDIGRVKIISMPCILTQNGKTLQNTVNKIVNDFLHDFLSFYHFDYQSSQIIMSNRA